MVVTGQCRGLVVGAGAGHHPNPPPMAKAKSHGIVPWPGGWGDVASPYPPCQCAWLGMVGGQPVGPMGLPGAGLADIGGLGHAPVPSPHGHGACHSPTPLTKGAVGDADGIAPAPHMTKAWSRHKPNNSMGQNLNMGQNFFFFFLN
jgi:hypothetical protein